VVAAGLRDIGIIVSPATRDAIAAAVGDGGRFGARVDYMEQAEPRGLAHAAQCARAFVGHEPFLMYLADTILPDGFQHLIETFRSPRTDAAVLVAPVDEPSRFGIAEVAADRIARLVEKPQRPASNLAVAGAYVFDQRIFDAIARLQPSWRNEYEITDAIQDLIDHGLIVRPCMVPGWWKDTGKPADLLAANRVLLDRIEPARLGALDAASVAIGRVRIEAGAHVIASRIEGPAIIGRDARIEHASLGPFASIGNRATVRGGAVRDSIVMASAALELNGALVEHSVLGERVTLRGHAGSVLTVILADDSSIGGA